MNAHFINAAWTKRHSHKGRLKEKGTLKRTTSTRLSKTHARHFVHGRSATEQRTSRAVRRPRTAGSTSPPANAEASPYRTGSFSDGIRGACGDVDMTVSVGLRNVAATRLLANLPPYERTTGSMAPRAIPMRIVNEYVELLLAFCLAYQCLAMDVWPTSRCGLGGR